MANLINDIGGTIQSIYYSLSSLFPKTKEVEKVIVKEVPMFKIPPGSRIFIGFAGISGALAVGLGAYGSHVLRRADSDENLKEIFEIANRYHFFHTLGLMSVPFARKPVLTGTLMTLGMTLFCGSCYIHALTGNKTFRKVTPYGGFLLIFAWASMIL